VGIAGSVAELPCDTIPLNTARLDQATPTVILLIVWYKDDVPVYRYEFSFKS
jgi:hypothetical protein